MLVQSFSPPNSLQLQTLPFCSHSLKPQTFLQFSSTSLPRRCTFQNPRPKPKLNLNPPISCTISQFHNYGTVDHESRAPPRWNYLYKRISMMEDPSLGSASVLNHWESQGRKFNKWDLCRVVRELRKFRRYKFALQVYEWMVKRGERFKFTTGDIAIQLDLIAKVKGVSSAEEFFSMLPESSKDKCTYGALLNAYVQAKAKDKAEDLLEKIKVGGYATEPLHFNVMMTLYMNIREYKKVFSMINEMREINVPLDIYSYNIWITTCASMEDVEKMERVVEHMTQDTGIIANWTTFSTLASMYIKLGHFEKANNCLKDVERRITGRDRAPFDYLISLYSNIGKKEDVYRIWNLYKSTFSSILGFGYRSMIASLARLGDIDGAEAIYKEWLSSRSNYDPRISNILMGWYTKEGLMKKAEIFLDDMLKVGVKPNPNTWEIMAAGYLKEKQISEALACMKEAASIKRAFVWRPKPANVAAFLSLCEEQDDSACVEGLVEILRNAGCLHLKPYDSLIRTHLNGALVIEESNLDIEDERCETDETEMLLSSYAERL